MKTTVIEVTLQGLLSPQQLPKLLEEVKKNMSPDMYRGTVVISGRLPLWAASAIVHLLHPAKCVSIFDPRIGGGVVVASHDPEVREGDVIPLPDNEGNKIQITF